MYSPKYETGGKFWPIVHYSIIFSLVLMHVIAIGLFGLKKLPLAASLIVPLPLLTLLFNEYCRKRFLPIFKAYPVEVCWQTDGIRFIFILSKKGSIWHDNITATEFVIWVLQFFSVIDFFCCWTVMPNMGILILNIFFLLSVSFSSKYLIALSFYAL